MVGRVVKRVDSHLVVESAEPRFRREDALSKDPTRISRILARRWLWPYPFDIPAIRRSAAPARYPSALNERANTRHTAIENRSTIDAIGALHISPNQP